jgi:hypothetical protein
VKLDAMHRSAMRRCYNGADIQLHAVALLLSEVEKIAPDMIKITRYPAGVKVGGTGAKYVLLHAELTDIGRDFVDGVDRAAPKASRQAKFKARLLRAGGKRISVNLNPETVGCLIVIQKHCPDRTMSDIVAAGIEAIARKVHNASKKET